MDQIFSSKDSVSTEGAGEDDAFLTKDSISTDEVGEDDVFSAITD